MPTPLGGYNPDWAVLVEQDGAERLYLVVETKGSTSRDELRFGESTRITCGREHFNALARASRARESRPRYVVASDLDGAIAQTG